MRKKRFALKCLLDFQRFIYKKRLHSSIGYRPPDEFEEQVLIEVNA